ncbi:flagellar hook-length control protein FliK [Aureimonas sp. AU4]|uniref:flagellar hook-length control protein FliK n=1 Tax=Aureimonas sp. AU4 TaxID=1638163 RepID=UPI0007804948|nr:flagellar hook-length control protein FliK [Aureimonas sp. AU4]
MKIDASPLLAPEKDAGPRGPRPDSRDEGAGLAFGAAVKNAGEKATAPKPRQPASEPGGAASAQPSHEETTPAKDEGKDAKGDETVGAKTPALDLMALMSAVTQPAAEPDAEDGEGTVAARPHAKEAAEGAGAEQTASRLPRVQVLRTETHFEPRMEGAVQSGPAAAASAASASAAADDLAARMALQLQEQGAGAAQAGADRLRTGGQAASADAEAASRPASIPVRFDEAVARLAQGGSRAGGDTGSGARQDGRDGGRRAAAERAETVADATRIGARSEALAAKGSDDASPAGGGAIPGLALQVASRIADALGSGPSTSGSAPRQAPFEGTDGSHLRMRAGGAALKTLTIQLQPEHLGTLEVSMRLREGKLAIELAASKPEAAAALTQDRETLRKVLESAGFSLDDAALTVTTRDAPALRASDAAGANANNGGDSSGSSFSGGQSSRRDETQQREARPRPSDRSDGEASSRTPAPGGRPAPRSAGQTYL